MCYCSHLILGQMRCSVRHAEVVLNPAADRILSYVCFNSSWILYFHKRLIGLNRIKLLLDFEWLKPHLFLPDRSTNIIVKRCCCSFACAVTVQRLHFNYWPTALWNIATTGLFSSSFFWTKRMEHYFSCRSVGSEMQGRVGKLGLPAFVTCSSGSCTGEKVLLLVTLLLQYNKTHLLLLNCSDITHFYRG